MRKLNRIDARRDQLKLLKLERRDLRYLAATLLDPARGQRAKLMAIGAAASAIIALQSAPGQYGEKLGLSISGNSIEIAHSYCDNLERLVCANADAGEIRPALQKLFEFVDAQHAEFETMAKKVDARLLKVADVIGDGGGNKEGPTSWLARFTM